jgi:hypothetical protein
MFGTQMMLFGLKKDGTQPVEFEGGVERRGARLTQQVRNASFEGPPKFGWTSTGPETP